MADSLARAVLEDGRLAISVAITTRICRRAQEIHHLTDTTTIALGRLATVTVLTGFIQDRPGSMSLQIISRGRVTQVFADVTEKGDARGYIKPSDFALPRYLEDERRGRRSIAGALGEGVLSVIQTAQEEPFRQSATNLVSGEIDVDVQHFFESSDQIPAAVVCDVLLRDDGRVRIAGGVLAQGLPGATPSRLEAIKSSLAGGGFACRLVAAKQSALSLLTSLFPDADVTDEAIALRFRCRCTMRRVLTALQTFDTVELARMVEAAEPVEVTCDFCNKVYTVTPAQMRRVFASIVEAQA